MKLDTLLTHVQPEWKGEFLRFVETGEAGEGFLAYLDQDASAQHAVEMAFDAQANAFENLAGELKKTQPAEEMGVVAGRAEPLEAVSAKVAAAVTDVSHLAPEERREAVAKVLTTLKTSLDSKALASARGVAHALAQDL